MMKVWTWIVMMGFLLMSCNTQPPAEESENTENISQEVPVDEEETSFAINEHKFLVTIKSMQFAPQNLEVSVGDTVVWVNQDIVTHNVTNIDDAWTSGDINVGDSWEMIIENEIKYYCTLHPTMKASVLVIGE